MIKKILATILIFFTAAPIAAGQTTASSSANSSTSSLLANLSDTAATLNQTRLIFNSVDTADWQNLASKDTTNYDRRWLLETLPAIVNNESNGISQLVIDRMRRGYAGETPTSREYPTSSNDSLHATGKAISISAINTTDCIDNTLFHQTITPVKPLWLLQQTGESDWLAQPESAPWFGTSFDRLARQGFWLAGRGFTNRLITSRTWTDFLQQIALSEIEERFGLRPGSLADVPATDLPNRLAETRLARQLGVDELPVANSADQFQTVLGELRAEQLLGLPSYSLSGKNWHEIYQNIGFRSLEEQLDLPRQSIASSPFPASNGLQSAPRFTALSKELQRRAALYQTSDGGDASQALGLPNPLYLPTNTGSDLLTRLTNGDTDAFATVGAFQLANRLQLSAENTAALTQAVDSGQDRLPSLDQSRPLAADLQPDRLFSSQTDADGRDKIFTTLGRAQEQLIADHLDRLNESLLASLSQSSQAPSLDDLIGTLTNSGQRDTVLQAVATASIEDANYGSDLSTTSLLERGQTILAETLGITLADLKSLNGLLKNSITATDAQEAALSTIEESFNWPAGTAQTLIRNQIDVVREKDMLRIGANQLWQMMEIPDTLQTALDNLYFTNNVPSDLGTSPVDTSDGETVTTTVPSPSPATVTVQASPSPDASETGDTTDETVTFDLNPNSLSLSEAIHQSTGLPDSEIANLLSGRIFVDVLSLAPIAHELGQSTTVTPAKLIEAYRKPNTDNLASLAPLKAAMSDDGADQIVSAAFFDQITQAATKNDLSAGWQTLQREIIRQWNISCPNKQSEAQAAIETLLKVVTSYSHDYTTTAETRQGQPEAPVQVITYSEKDISQTTREAIKAAYTNMGDPDIKWGLLPDSARDWDHVYLSY